MGIFPQSWTAARESIEFPFRGCDDTGGRGDARRSPPMPFQISKESDLLHITLSGSISTADLQAALREL